MLNPILRHFNGDAARLYTDSTDSTPLTSENGPSSSSLVTVRIKDILPMLIDAIHQKRAWVDDFRDDPISISRDLYEVLLAVDRYKKSAA